MSMKKMEVSQYSGRITSAHITSPRYKEWVEVLLSAVTATGDLSCSIPEAFAVRRAKGVQLDVIGSSIGVRRELQYTGAAGRLNDDDFRSYILAKILRSRWDGQNASLLQLWQQVYPGININIIDHMNMSMTVELKGDISQTMGEMIQTGLIIPIPSGVSVTYSITVTTIPTKQVGLGTGLFHQSELGLTQEVQE